MTKFLTITLLVMLTACENSSVCEMPEDLSLLYLQQPILENQIKKYKAYTDSTKRFEYLSHMTEYDDFGRVKFKYRCDSLEGCRPYERYTYDDNDRMIRIDIFNSESNWEISWSNLFMNNGQTEIIYNYENGELLNTTIFFNDIRGRHIYNEYYEDSTLINTNQFFYNGDCLLDSVLAFDSSKQRLDKLRTYTYKNSLLENDIIFENGDTLAFEYYEYNRQGLVSTYRFGDSYSWYTDTYIYDDDFVLKTIESVHSFRDSELEKDTFIVYYEIEKY